MMTDLVALKLDLAVVFSSDNQRPTNGQLVCVVAFRLVPTLSAFKAA